jgi:uncharacterized surface protein with fasciclin (FAS1) repeats
MPLRAALPFFLLLLLVACSSDEEPVETTEIGVVEEVNPTLLELLGSDPQFSTLVTAIEATNLQEPLSDAGALTLFAPTNSAFNALPAGTIDTLMTDGQREMLRNILLHHLVDGKTFATDAMTAGELTTLLGDRIAVTVDGETIRVADAEVQARDLEASNGIIHIIDQVMLPSIEATGGDASASEESASDEL